MSDFLTPILINDPPTFPLDPLTPTELQQAVDLVLNSPLYQNDPSALIDTVELSLPTKASVLAFRPGNPLIRKAYVGVYSPVNNKYFEYIIDLNNNTNPGHFNASSSFRPAWNYVENAKVSEVVLKDNKVKAALRSRGVTNKQISDGTIQPNTLVDGRLDEPCAQGLPNLEGKPRPRSYYMNFLKMDGGYDTEQLLGNWYVQPLAGAGKTDQGVWVWVNANTGEVLQVDNLKGTDNSVIPTNQGLTNINNPPNAYANGYRGTLKPIVVGMPEGVSWTLDGCLLNWQRWRFRILIHPITGINLFLIEYNYKKNQSEPDDFRSIIYQADIAEAITVYGTPDFGSKSFNFLDFGEYPTRAFATSLLPGVDVPPYATMYNPVFVDETGTLVQYPDAIAIYEEDGDILWRHNEFNVIGPQGRRNRKLVIAQANCIGNYDYVFFWKFDLAGAMDFSVKASGMLEMEAGVENTPYVQRVQDNLVSPNHQHFFNYRLNFMVGGTKNSIYEVDDKQVSDCTCECGNLWEKEETLLKLSGDSARNSDPRVSRVWSVKNDLAADNKFGLKPAYSLYTADSVKNMSTDATRITKRMPFMNSTIYVTTYQDTRDNQYFSGGHQVEQGKSLGIVPSENYFNNIQNKDLVVYCTLSFSHRADPAHFPVMNCETKSLSITPDGCFLQNPTMDVDINTYRNLAPSVARNSFKRIRYPLRKDVSKIEKVETVEKKCKNSNCRACKDL